MEGGGGGYMGGRDGVKSTPLGITSSARKKHRRPSLQKRCFDLRQTSTVHLTSKESQPLITRDSH